MGKEWCTAVATTCVDFPPVETPGHKGFVTATHNINPVFPNKNIALANDGDNFTWIQVPNANDADIYFPVDGRQPTTPEAVAWSCANVDVDNREDSPITKWYMRMFGWTNSPEETPLQMGFAPLTSEELGDLYKKWNNLIEKKFYLNTSLGNSDQDITSKPETIITFDKSMDENNKQKFWEIFHEEASVPVGRILLYRLLIEIRRTRGGIGALDSGTPETKEFADIFHILFGADTSSTHNNSPNPPHSQLQNEIDQSKSKIDQLKLQISEKQNKIDQLELQISEK